MKKIYPLLLIILLTAFTACTKDISSNEPTEAVQDVTENTTLTSTSTRSIPTEIFDWENADWMPTPPGQTRIPSPWMGQGSLGSVVGLDVVEDRRACDGWELVFSSFSTNGPELVPNPYFILYNKYRGIIRTYIYINTQFVISSSYLQDNISISSPGNNSSIFNFLGKEWIDMNEPFPQSYQQIQPGADDGTPPLATNKWYMTQHELAYDKNLVGAAPYNLYSLTYNFDYCNVMTISLGGNITGRINGVIGSASTANNPISAIKDGVNTAGKGVFAIISGKILSKYGNAQTGENRLGLSEKQFKAIESGLLSAVSGAASGIPGAAIGLLNAIIGGSSQQGPTPINMTVEADINLTGTTQEKGSLPSMPLSFWIPGTAIEPNAPHYIPVYNKPLGVINFTGKPLIKLNYEITKKDWLLGRNTLSNTEDSNTSWLAIEAKVAFPQNINYSSYLTINPEVSKIANITVEQELVFSRNVKTDYIAYQLGEQTTFMPQELVWNNHDQLMHRVKQIDRLRPCPFPDDVRLGVRFIVKIQPHNGAPASTIIKTLEADWMIEGEYGTITPGQTLIFRQTYTKSYAYVYERPKDLVKRDQGYVICAGKLSSSAEGTYGVKKLNESMRFYVFSTMNEEMTPFYELKSTYKYNNISSQDRVTYRYVPIKGNTVYSPKFYLFAQSSGLDGRIPVYEIEHTYIEKGKPFDRKYSCFYLTTNPNLPISYNTNETYANLGIVGYTTTE